MSSYLSNVDDLLVSEIEHLNSIQGDVWSLPDRDPRDSGHAFFQYPAMMVPEVQRTLIKLIKNVQPRTTKLLDPYVGAGTSLSAGMHSGIDSYGQDINPLAILVSRVKTGPFFTTALKKRITLTVEKARSDKTSYIEVDFPNHDKWFRKDVSMELSKLKRAIEQDDQIWARRFMWVTLAETVRRTSNDRTTTYKLHARPNNEIESRNISPIEVFCSLAKQNLEDLEKYKEALGEVGYVIRGRYTGDVRIELGDSSEKIHAPTGNPNVKYDLLITSPPYGDNKTTITYGQHAYLPLQWINLADIDPSVDPSFLKSTAEIDTRSLGGRRNRELGEQIEKLSSCSPTLRDTFANLSEQLRDRPSRVAAFYDDFIASIKHIVNSLSSNAYLIWTTGNRRVGGIEIPNNQILTELLERENVTLVTQLKRNIHHKRMPHRNQIAQMMHYEQIMIFRKTI